jgi:hypothetical protein
MLAGMPSAGQRDRIIQVLRQASRPLDDDDLAKRATISPRQTVNRLCRALENANVLRRYPGPDGKIVNELATAADSGHVDGTGSGPAARRAIAAPAGTIIAPAGDHAIPPGSSHEQRDAERTMLDILGQRQRQRLGLGLEPATISTPSGAPIEVDGADSGRTVLVEC